MCTLLIFFQKNIFTYQFSHNEIKFSFQTSSIGYSKWEHLRYVLHDHYYYY